MISWLDRLFADHFQRLAAPEPADIAAAVVFAVIYGFRLGYQAYLLRNRDRSAEPGNWGELLLVVVPKNALVILTVYLLAFGVPFNFAFIFGWFFFLVGIALRLVALYQLGPMYSLNVEIRSKHNLITTGAYGIVRHPLYLAYILDTLGIVIFLQRWYFWIVVVLVIVGWALRIRTEEAALRAAFGAEYDAYAETVPALNPFAQLVRPPVEKQPNAKR